MRIRIWEATNMPIRPNRPAFFTASALLLSALCIIAPAKTIYVDDDATGANNGSSWQDAYTFLQDALADANSGEKPVEIRVAQGTYAPDQGSTQKPGDQEATFQLISDVALKGGYAGTSSIDPNSRDLQSYESILSGDLNRNDAGNKWSQSRDDNSYHIVTVNNVHKTGLLDGFTIVGGFAYGEMSFFGGDGGGIFVKGGSPTLRNCKLTDCLSYLGGAMYIEDSNAAIIKCIFTDNHAFNGGAIYCLQSDLELTSCAFYNNIQTREYWWIDIFFYEGGGGLYCKSGSPKLKSCVFSGNRAEQGGGLFNNESDTTLIDCSFNHNMALGMVVSYGGGMFNMDSSPMLVNCTFSSNSTDLNVSGEGSAIHSFGHGPILTNCTLFGNWAPCGGAVTGASVMSNCILWANVAPQVSGEADISYSNIQGGWEGEGNINVDPLFADPGYWADVNDPNVVVEPNDPNALWVDGDYHLKSQAGRWDRVSASWVRDDMTSPCIDAGDRNYDWGAEVWPHGGRVNMGAYGGTPEASMSAGPQELSLPQVAYICGNDMDAAESFQALLVRYGCSTELIKLGEAAAAALDSYDLIVIGNDTGFTSSWGDAESVASIEASGKPVVGIGEGGYAFFGKLGLSIGWPNGAHGSRNSIAVIDPNNPIFSEPYPVDVPEDRSLELYTETEHVGLYLWPVPETVTAIGGEVDDPGYYPLVLEDDRYLFWGFEGSAEHLTEAGTRLLINTIIHTANTNWATNLN